MLPERPKQGPSTSGNPVLILSIPSEEMTFWLLKPVKTQVGYFVENELNDHMFFQFVKALRINSLGHLPRVNRQIGRSASIQVESDDFSIMEIRPESEPVVKLLRSFNRLKF
jgi:hypothetical protein